MSPLESGLPLHAVLNAADLLIDFVHGYTPGESAGRLASQRERKDALEQWLAARSGHFPAHEVIFGGPDSEIVETSFAGELEIVIAGIAAMMAA